MRIVHVSDIHWRGLSRHDEYRESFLDFFEKSRNLNPDVIYVGGDIVHSKTQGISPELIDSLSWWFTELAKIAPTHVILGNHDGLMHNHDRQDAITPIITALGNPRIHLYKKSGVYPTGIPGFNWCVFSCFDEGRWKDVTPESDSINIALFHGAVWGSKTDIDWNIDGDVDTEFFKDYDFALLGDIHKCQFLNDRKTIAYSGSSIQQNYGEGSGKGFLFWDIRNKSDFDVEFYEIYHSKPFITVDWAGSVDNTMASMSTLRNGARFRIRSDSILRQTDINLLCSRLKIDKKATEIVFKIDQKVDSEIFQLTSKETFFKENLRDVNTHKKLMRIYNDGTEISESEWRDIDDLLNRYMNEISRSDTIIRNTRWSIKQLEFDNTFAYGKNNIINFEKLGGITGIFGKNRKGKSSIIGTLMYSLFNTTDRGPIKNVHIINSRKNSCKASVLFSVNSLDYKVARQTVRHQTRKGEIYSSTSLDLHRIDSSDGEILNDLNGEQRRDTEKTLRKIVGTADDFLLTSLASQGEINTFIKEKATSRKAILSKFLDLDVFEKMHALAKDESASTRSQIKSFPTLSWDNEIKKLKKLINQKRKENDEIESILEKLRQKRQDLKIRLATSPDRDVTTPEAVLTQKSLIKNSKDRQSKLCKKITKLESDISKKVEIIDRISSVISDFSIQNINQKIDTKRALEKSLITSKHELDKQRTVMRNLEKSVKKLENIPCGDKFPKCKFIKDSHSNKRKISDQIKTVETLRENVKISTKVLSSLEKEYLENKLEKFNLLISKMSQIKVEISQDRLTLHQKKIEKSSLKEELDNLEDDLSEMELNVVDDTSGNEATKIKKKISELSETILMQDTKRLLYAETVGKSEHEVKSLKEEKNRFNTLNKKLKVYDNFIQSVSKNGIPKQIIRSQLPLINTEIAKILQGVAGFTVELESCADSSTMDIFIDYGDSRRIIELASGMEKMMASLAIRVALINISSLPKTDMFIIDEGFGSLDAGNIEVCSRLLQSLKKWFKNIIIISHVDAIKDSVDNVLDITWSGKNAKIEIT